MSSPHSSPPAAPGPDPQVSFIVPLFNRLALTQAMLASLQATLPAGLAHEIILIDDGSSDGTREWLATMASPPFRVLLNERNLGYAITNNRAAAVARGELLALLNFDLVLLPGWLEPMLEARRTLGTRAGVIGNVQLDAKSGAIDHTGIVINRTGKPEHRRALPPRLVRALRPVEPVPAVTGACLLVEAALWRQLGGFDEAYLNGGEDVDLCFRARAAGRVNAVALRSIVRHHVSAAQGRKLRDEENSYRLARTWQAEFIATAQHATREWCRDYLADMLAAPRSAEYGLAFRAAAHATHLAAAPIEAIAAIEEGLGREFARWQQMFSQ